MANGTSNAGNAIEFSMDGGGGATVYNWTLTDAQQTVVQSGQQVECTLQMPARELTSGMYCFKVQAANEMGVLMEAELQFSLTVNGEFPMGGRPGGGGGGRPSSSGRPSGSAAGEGMEGEEQGLQVTPGEALTSSHSSGTKDMQAYGSVSLELPEEAVGQLILGESALDVALSDGGQFTETLEDNCLILTPQSGAECWQVNGLALQTLSKSGIDQLELRLDGGVQRLSTDFELSGDVYAALRAQGLVSKDFTWVVSAEGIQVWVESARYALSESGELIPEAW